MASKGILAGAIRIVAKWYSVPLLLLVWQVLVGSGLVESRLLPSLARVWGAFQTDVLNGDLIYHASITVGRAVSGYVLAALVGIPFAAMMARSPTFRNLFEPVFFFGYPIPKIALFPVFTFIFGLGTPSKIAFTFLECLYPIVLTSYLGFRGVQTRLVWTAQNFGASRNTILRRVILPAAMPSIFSGLRIAGPISMIVVVVTEMIGDSVGLGYYITIWSTRFTFENVYAGIIMIGICGFTLDRTIVWSRKKIVYWQGEEARF
jgi:NitT/TauT family transport system permease protein